MQNPTVKFWCWVVSEVVFVMLLLTNTILMQYNIFHADDQVSDSVVIDRKSNPKKFCNIYIFVSSFFIRFHHYYLLLLFG